ncbi:helix-turn-helix domain-containing protein [Megasphaera vaginalis (ex Bordigoni et al. 2020)]|uniref:helix-turn-helix domain-containing protein n=1 Tax=Megasphaera vaginalis (ex Bordigoni et al. 2020) TaxID=2045301 RepID=UPI000C7A7853|nr:helix-turn-helix domain-containing protein [Megasphaera vaginalis (ex Bordigoni et al. 2020)]
MVDTNALRGIIAREGKSQVQVADALGITPKTFYEKMKKGVFNSDELYAMVKFLNISNPIKIFLPTRLRIK